MLYSKSKFLNLCTMNKKLKFTLTVALVAASASLQAQVTIGSGEKPEPMALLQLKENSATATNASKGLGLPRVSLVSLDKLQTVAQPEITDSIAKERHAGLTVYNLATGNELQPGIYVWNGRRWKGLSLF